MAIFFSDMDGTLLNDQKQISPRMKEALDRYVARGNHFVISTGRPLFSAKYLRDSLDLRYPNSYISCFNGAMLYDNETESPIFQTGIPLTLVPEIFAFADARGIYVHTFQEEHVVAREQTEELAFYMANTHIPAQIEQDMSQALRVPPCKILAISLHDPDALREFAEAFRETFGNEVAAAFSSECFLELFPAHHNKGDALRHLCDHLQVPISDSIASGDQENDIPALQAASFSIAMKNAQPAVKEVADVVTEEDNNHDGLLPYLQ